MQKDASEAATLEISETPTFVLAKTGRDRSEGVRIVVAQPVAMAPDSEPYTLDSGDKLRVVVFGQDGLSASYSVDTAGRITMPLIGAVPARGILGVSSWL